MSIACLGFAVCVGFVLVDSEEIAFGLTPLLRVLLIVAQVSAVLAALTVVACMIAGKHGYWRLSGRVHYTLVALAGVGFVAWLYYWSEFCQIRGKVAAPGNYLVMSNTHR